MVIAFFDTLPKIIFILIYRCSGGTHDMKNSEKERLLKELEELEERNEKEQEENEEERDYFFPDFRKFLH